MLHGVFGSFIVCSTAWQKSFAAAAQINNPRWKYFPCKQHEAIMLRAQIREYTISLNPKHDASRERNVTAQFNIDSLALCSPDKSSFRQVSITALASIGSLLVRTSPLIRFHSVVTNIAAVPQ
jgi:hypothetical protein